MKLAYLTLQATREGQAAHAHVYEIVAGLRRRGVDVTLFEADYGKKLRPSPLRRLCEFVRLQAVLTRHVKDFDALYIRSHFAAFPIAMVAKLLKVPTLHEINGASSEVAISYPWMRSFATLVNWMLTIQFRSAKALVAVTPQLAQWAAGETANTVPALVIPNGANTDLFNPEATTTKSIAGPYAIFFGALSRWQGIDTLLKAATHEDWPRGVKLVIAGDGVEAPRVREATSERIIYLGKVPYSEMGGLIAQAFVSISAQNNISGHSDTGLSPLKLHESLACGTPVVVTDFPYMADTVRDSRTGIVVSPGDAGALARAVATLHAAPGLRHDMSTRARRTALAEHSWKKRAADTFELLNWAIGNSSANRVPLKAEPCGTNSER